MSLDTTRNGSVQDIGKEAMPNAFSPTDWLEMASAVRVSISFSAILINERVGFRRTAIWTTCEELGL
jgi:hypothetical protein